MSGARSVRRAPRRSRRAAASSGRGKKTRRGHSPAAGSSGSGGKGIELPLLDDHTAAAEGRQFLAEQVDPRGWDGKTDFKPVLIHAACVAEKQGEMQ